MSAQENARLERKRRQAEAFAEKVDAEETGADLERKKAWEYSIADNDAWDKKQAKKQRRAQFEFTGAQVAQQWLCVASGTRSDLFACVNSEQTTTT